MSVQLYSAVILAGPNHELENEDLGRIWVGQLPGSGALYALPASYYGFDFPDNKASACPPGGSNSGGGPGGGKGLAAGGKGGRGAAECADRALPALAWDASGRCGV